MSATVTPETQQPRPTPTDRRSADRSRHLALAVGVLAAVGLAVATWPSATDEFIEAEPPTAQATNSIPPPPSPERVQYVEGEVLEVLNVSRYTYLRLGPKGSAGTWTAVPSASARVGDRVRVRDLHSLSNFTSSTLGRTFERIHFGVIDRSTGPLDRSGPPMPHGGAEPAAAPASAHPFEDPDRLGPVRKAEGRLGHRIAEIHQAKERLAGQRVRVRGVVVKATTGVLNRTFVHLRDGTGDPQASTHDLTVTTSATPAVGETVLIEGVLATNRDFGHGYRYHAIVEDAAVISDRSGGD